MMTHLDRITTACGRSRSGCVVRPSIATALLVTAALACGTTSGAAKPAGVGPTPRAGGAMPCRALPADKDVASWQRRCRGAEIMPGEDVASFVEEHGADADPSAAREAFDAWRRDGRGTLVQGIARLQARLERTIAARGLTLRPGTVTISAARTGSARPWVMSAPSGTAVVLDDRLFGALYALVSAAYDTGLDHVPAGCDAVLDALRSQPMVRPRFSAALRYWVGVARNGRFDLVPRNPETILALVRSAELFLLAQEYAHLMLGHTPVAGHERTVMGTSDGPLRAVEPVYERDQQLAADALAFELVQETVRRDGTPVDAALAPYGPEILVFTTGLLEKARAVFAGEEAPLTLSELVQANLPSAPARPRDERAATLLASASGEPTLGRRTALREAVRRWHRGAAANDRDVAALIERTDSCLFATVNRGVATAGEKRRSSESSLPALERTLAEAHRD